MRKRRKELKPEVIEKAVIVEEPLENTITIDDAFLELAVKNGKDKTIAEFKDKYKKLAKKTLDKTYEEKGLNDLEFFLEEFKTYPKKIKEMQLKADDLKIILLNLSKKIDNFFLNHKSESISRFLDRISKDGMNPIQAFLSNKALLTSPILFKENSDGKETSYPTRILDSILKNAQSTYDSLITSRNWRSFDQLITFERLEKMMRDQEEFYAEISDIFDSPDDVSSVLEPENLKASQKNLQEEAKARGKQDELLPKKQSPLSQAVLKLMSGKALYEVEDLAKAMQAEQVVTEEKINEKIDAVVDYKWAEAVEKKFREKNSEEIKKLEAAKKEKDLAWSFGPNEYADALETLKEILDEPIIVDDNFEALSQRVPTTKLSSLEARLKSFDEAIAASERDIKNIIASGELEGNGLFNQKKRKRDSLVKYSERKIEDLRTKREVIDREHQEILLIKSLLEPVNIFLKKLKNSGINTRVLKNTPMKVSKLLEQFRLTMEEKSLSTKDQELDKKLTELQERIARAFERMVSIVVPKI